MIRFLHGADDNGPQLRLHLDDSSDTETVGGALAQALAPALHVDLQGDLGAGKTTLVRGLLRSLGYQGNVKSPTYTLIEPYAVSRLDLYHFDFYRFTDPAEFLEAGLDEYFAGDGICLVEWPDKARPPLPPADLEIRLTVEGTGRSLVVVAPREAGRTCLNKLVSILQTLTGASNTLPPSAGTS